MARDASDVLKQLTTYADGITAFSFLQSLAFVFSVGGSSGVGVTVHHHPYISAGVILISLAVYLYLLVRCHRNEDRLVGVPEKEKNQALGETVKETRLLRFAIVIVATLLCLGITVAAAITGVNDQAQTTAKKPGQ